MIVMTFTMTPLAAFAADPAGPEDSLPPVSVENGKGESLGTLQKMNVTGENTNTNSKYGGEVPIFYKLIVPADTSGKLTFRSNDGEEYYFVSSDYGKAARRVNNTGTNPNLDIGPYENCDDSIENQKATYSVRYEKADSNKPDCGEPQFYIRLKNEDGDLISLEEAGLDTRRYIAYLEFGESSLYKKQRNSAVFGLFVQFGEDQNITDTNLPRPLRVRDESGETYPVEITDSEEGIKYSVENDGKKYVATVQDKIYKVVVPDDVQTLRFDAPSSIQSVGHAVLSRQNIWSGTVELSRTDLWNEYYTAIPKTYSDENAEAGKSLAERYGMDTSRKIAYVNFYDITYGQALKSFWAAQNSAQEIFESPSPSFGLLIQFGEEQQQEAEVNVSVEDIQLKDAGKPLRINEANTIVATLKNNGETAASGFRVKLQADGSRVKEITYDGSIAAGKSAEVEFSFIPAPKSSRDNAGKTELTVIVNNRIETAKKKTFIFGKYSITIECLGTEEGRSDMQIASINAYGYYDEAGNYADTYKPNPENYRVDNGKRSATYVLRGDYGIKWDVTFDTPDGQCLARVTYEDNQSAVLVGNTALLVFDKERFGRAYYEEIEVENISDKIGITADGRFAEQSYQALEEGNAYDLFLSWRSQSATTGKSFQMSVYEDERLLISTQTEGPGYSGKILEDYYPRYGAQSLRILVKQGQKIVADKVIGIQVAAAEQHTLQFMETPLRKNVGGGFVGTTVGRVHKFSDGETIKYVTSAPSVLYYAGNGIWEPLAVKQDRTILDLSGGYNEEEKVDLATLKGVGQDGALYQFDGKSWVKTKAPSDDGLESSLKQAYFIGDSIVAAGGWGTQGSRVYIAQNISQGDTLTWTRKTEYDNCYSMLMGNDGNIYLTKYNGSLYQYDGETWKEIRVQTGFPAKVIAAESAQDIWIAAQVDKNTAKLLHFDRTTWKEYPTPLAIPTLPTGILTADDDIYCVYLGSLWHTSNQGVSWMRVNIISSGSAGNTLERIQKTEDGNFYLGTKGAFYYDGTALGETAVSDQTNHARTVRISISGSLPQQGKEVAWSGKVTVDNQLDVTKYLTYYKDTKSSEIPPGAYSIYGAYSKEEGRGFEYPTVLHALIQMLLDRGVDLETKEDFTYRDGGTYSIPKNLDIQANLNGKVYLAMANGLREFDGGQMSGWMYRVNGELPNLGFSEYALSDGDQISIFYVTSYQSGGASPGSPSRLSTAEYGHQQEIEIATGTSLTFKAEVKNGTNYYDADMAFLYVDGRRFYNYTATGAKETAMTGEDGLLTMTFDKDGVYEINLYKQGVYAMSNTITVRVGSGNVKPEIILKAAQSRSTPNTALTLTVTDTAGNPMQGIQLYMASDDEEISGAVTDAEGKATVRFAKLGTYEIYAKGEETKASAKITVKIAEELGNIDAAMSDALELANRRADALTDKSPWNSIALDRQVSDTYTSGTLNELVQEIGQSIEAKSGTQYEVVTDYAKWVLAIQAAGGDPSSLVYNNTKIDLLSKIYNFHVRLNDGTVKTLYAQGLNAPIWSLIALDSVPEAVPENARYSKADLVEYILRAQKADGSFALSAEYGSDVDITVMALQALARHREESGVKTAIDKAVTWLAAQQQEDGGFTSINTVNCESTAQTIIALTTLGMDPAAAPFKTETGKTMLDALLYYHLGNGSFAHTENTSGVLTANDMASEQAHLALTAYDRYQQKAVSLYDMSSTERVDRYAPVITTNGLRTCTTDEKTLRFTVTASDAKDGSITPKVEVKAGELGEYQELSLHDGQYEVYLGFDRSQTFFRITATDAAGNTATEEYVVTYSAKPVVKTITLPDTLQTAEIGRTLTLQAEIAPTDAHNQTLQWTSSDPGIATVDENGVVTPHKSGTVTVTAVSTDGSRIAASCTVVCKFPQTQQPDDKTIRVSFTLLGDQDHGGSKPHHTLKEGGLETWIAATTVTIEKGATVGDVFSQVLTEKGYTFVGLSKNYIRSITTPGGLYMAEFTNGNLSGWMYTVNGHHPEVGLNSYVLTNGDRIIWHYTDDYTKEEGSEKWNTQNDEVKNVTTDTKTATTTAPTEVKVSGSTAAATVKAENQSEILKQAAENKSAEIVLEVAASDTKGAESVQMQLDTAFVKDIVEKTNADLTVNTENGKVTLNQEALKAIIGEAKGSTILIEIAKVTKPTEAQKKAAGANGDIFSLLVKSGDKIISDFNKGKATVRVEIPAKLADKKVAAIYLADDAKIEQLAGKVLSSGGKKYYEFTTPHFSTFALVDAEELGLEVAEEPQTDAKALAAKLTPVARSAKTAKKNVKVTVSLDKQDKAIIKELKDAGYTVKYRFYRSTKKAAGYKAAVTKKTVSYTNTSGKKGMKYFYKVQVRVYDENGMLTAKTALKQCKYASRIWAKAN